MVGSLVERQENNVTEEKEILECKLTTYSMSAPDDVITYLVLRNVES